MLGINMTKLEVRRKEDILPGPLPIKRKSPVENEVTTKETEFSFATYNPPATKRQTQNHEENILMEKIVLQKDPQIGKIVPVVQPNVSLTQPGSLLVQQSSHLTEQISSFAFQNRPLAQQSSPLAQSPRSSHLLAIVQIKKLPDQNRSPVQFFKCSVKNAQCQGELFGTAYDLRYHYSKHARSALSNHLQLNWPNFTNDTNTCASCDIMFGSKEKLTFHIGAKHREVDTILVQKGIPIPRDYVIPDNVFQVSENVEPNATEVNVASPAVESNMEGSTRAKTEKSKPQVNYYLKCEVCETVVKTLGQLHQHCCTHFIRNIESKFPDLIAPDGKMCNICGYTGKCKTQLIMHLGCKHGKVNDILVENGYKTLPCPVAPKSHKDGEIQKKLIQLKKEKLESLGEKTEGENEEYEENYCDVLNETEEQVSFENIYNNIANINKQIQNYKQITTAL